MWKERTDFKSGAIQNLVDMHAFKLRCTNWKSCFFLYSNISNALPVRWHFYDDIFTSTSIKRFHWEAGKQEGCMAFQVAYKTVSWPVFLWQAERNVTFAVFFFFHHATYLIFNFQIVLLIISHVLLVGDDRELCALEWGHWRVAAGELTLHS